MEQDRNRPRLEKKPQDMKKMLGKIFVDLGIIKAGFTGTVIIDLNRGGVGTIRKTENL